MRWIEMLVGAWAKHLAAKRVISQIKARRQEMFTLEMQLQDIEASFRANERKLERQYAEIETMVQRNRELLKQQAKLTDKTHQLLKETDAELKIAKNVTIPSLLKANKTFENAWDAQAASLAMQTGAMSSKKSDDLD